MSDLYDAIQCRKRLDLAKQALVATEYFTKEQVTDDVAPRIAELYAAARKRKVPPYPSGERPVDLTDHSVYPGGKVPEADTEICLKVLRTLHRLLVGKGPRGAPYQAYTSAIDLTVSWISDICRRHNAEFEPPRPPTPDLLPKDL